MIAAFLYQGSGAIPIQYQRMRYCREMHLSEVQLTELLRTQPGRFGRHLYYMQVEAEHTPRE